MQGRQSPTNDADAKTRQMSLTKNACKRINVNRLSWKDDKKSKTHKIPNPRLCLNNENTYDEKYKRGEKIRGVNKRERQADSTLVMSKMRNNQTTKTWQLGQSLYTTLIVMRDRCAAGRNRPPLHLEQKPKQNRVVTTPTQSLVLWIEPPTFGLGDDYYTTWARVG